MARFVVGCLAMVVVAGCSAGNTADFTLKGPFATKDVDVKVSLTSGGGAVTDGTNYGDNRNTADQLAIIGGQVAWTSLSGPCPAEPCPDNVELVLWTPSASIHAGPWVLPSYSTVKLDKDFDTVLGEDVGGALALDFQEPEFSWSGSVVLRQKAKFAPGPSPRGWSLEGEVSLEYQCHEQSKYFRHCGESIAGDGMSNPLHLPYVESSCPPELVAPYEASPKWDGNTLQLGELRVPCRETAGGRDGEKAAVLCYSKRTVEAAGCTWTVHFLTDGKVYQFAIAGFADASCAVKTCNTYR